MLLIASGVHTVSYKRLILPGLYINLLQHLICCATERLIEAYSDGARGSADEARGSTSFLERFMERSIFFWPT